MLGGFSHHAVDSFSEIEKVIEEPVDESNLDVLNLVSVGFTLKQSIDAMIEYGTVRSALVYLESMEGDEEVQADIGHVATPKEHIFREDHDTIMNW